LSAAKPLPLSMTRRQLLSGAGALGGFLLVGCSPAAEAGSERAADGGARPAAAAQPMMIVHKDPNCGCCQSWADIAEQAGYPVRIVNEADMAAVKARLGVPEELASCHTTEVSGLVVEGHVPLETVERMLRERPQGLRGIAVPGMPAGSPGMEVPDGTRQPYQVIAFFEDGRTSVVQSVMG
jgi:hypothetical protein